MGSNVNIMRVPMTDSGFDYNRNFELVPDPALIDTSCNFNLHNLGIEKRGGTSIIQSATDPYKVMGGYDFRKTTGNQYMVYGKSNGKVYSGSDGNVIGTGMALSNYFHFSQFLDTLFVSDGSSTPKTWSGTGTLSNVTPATDWATSGNPFQIIYHARGTNARMWAVTKNGLYASKNSTPTDFADADVRFVPVYSKGGLVAACEFGQEIFAFSKTETFRIDDSGTDITTWGYKKAIWEGGAAHWRLIVQADNDLFIMTEDLTIYSLQGVFQTGDYRKAALTRPAQIDRYLRENATYTNIEQWHASYDPKLRCIKWFVQVGGTAPNMALVQFIDREPQKMWAIHNNKSYTSGYNASCSFTYRKNVSDFRIRTGDANGNIWQLEEANRNDNNNPIPSVIKFKLWEFKNPLMHKFFPKGVLRIRSNTNITFKVLVTIDNIRIPEIILFVSSSGAIFDTSTFDNSYFASDSISKTPFDIKSFGETVTFEINHSNVNEDFFLSEVMIAFKENGVRIFA